MTIDEYVTAVVNQLPRQLVDRQRVEADLRTHVADRVAAGASPEDAVQHLGTANEVAAELLTSVKLAPAARTRRIIAFLIDAALGVVPVFLAGTFLFVPFMSPFETADILASGIFMTFFAIAILTAIAIPFLSLFYFPVLEKLFGQTLGKWLLGIVVVRETGATLRWRDAFIRRIPFLFEFFWLDALFALFTAKKQRAFDMVASTMVVPAVRATHRSPATVPEYGVR